MLAYVYQVVIDGDDPVEFVFSKYQYAENWGRKQAKLLGYNSEEEIEQALSIIELPVYHTSKADAGK